MKNKKVLVVLSHNLTSDQVEGLNQMGIEEILMLKEVNPDLFKLTSQIPATWGLKQVQFLSCSVVQYATKLGCDYIVCQGEPCLALNVNLVAKEAGFTCLQSTTERVVEEEKEQDGSVTKRTCFKHVRWREII